MKTDVAAIQTPSSPVSAPSTKSSITLDEQAEIISMERNKAKEEPMEMQIEDPPPVAECPKPRRTKGHYRLTDFIIQRTIGAGSCGRVHLVRSKHNSGFYVIKVLNKERVVKMEHTKQANHERLVLEQVEHPFVIHLWGTFQDATNLYMVLDFVPGGDLFTLLQKSNRFPEIVAKFYAGEVALALKYLHSLDIIHRDLKLENILLSKDGNIKVADFGFAKVCATTTGTLCGTSDYLAPEIVNEQRYNKSVDWYALGVLIFEMLSGLPPYHQAEPNHMILYERITRGPAYIRWPAHFGQNATDIILKLMEPDPSKRYGNMQHGAGDVFAHPWFGEVNWDTLAGREIDAPHIPRICGDGDASVFDKFPDEHAADNYGLPAPDPYGEAFPGFEYATTETT